MKRLNEMTLGTILLMLGALAGWFFGRITSNLAPKEMIMQWDIGNTVVGIATIFLAGSYFIISKKERDSSIILKIMELRIKWIEDLRSECANIYQNALELTTNVPMSDELIQSYDKCVKNLLALRASISMKLNKNELHHLNLLKSATKITQIAINIDNAVTEKAQNVEFEGKSYAIHEIRKELSLELINFADITKAMTKLEWQSATKNEPVNSLQTDLTQE